MWVAESSWNKAVDSRHWTQSALLSDAVPSAWGHQLLPALQLWAAPLSTLISLPGPR